MKPKRKPISPTAGSKRVVMNVSEREFATILAALRYWRPCSIPEDEEVSIEFFNDIATSGGQFERLTGNEIDTLCENINCN